MQSLQILINPLVIAVAAALAVLVLFVGLGRAGRSGDEAIEERLGPLRHAGRGSD